MGTPTNPSFAGDAAAIRATLVEALRAKRSQDPAIRLAVETCARNARLEGCKPEELVIGLKSLVDESTLPEVRDWYRSFLLDRVISWSIQAFFKT